ncbi:hypothetical protein [Paenibacillus faecalis]|uniref:hypothetical protein n=1 Tax=Paenibacillus faecalis TaxID=2079532 RepID=UPI000D10299D|nr:hypothetical protein [Paenibacillus faecalis]
MKRLSIQLIVFWIMIALAAFGLVLNLFSPWVFIPLAVVGIVYLLYKFPPARFNKHRGPTIKPSKKTAAKLAGRKNATRRGSPSSKRKNYPFQVIDGQKGKNDPPDDMPKYH